MITIQRTRFEDLQKGEFIGTNYGFRIYDDNKQTYCNTLSQADMMIPESSFLKLVLASFPEIVNSFFVMVRECPIEIDGKVFGFEEIKEILETAKN